LIRNGIAAPVEPTRRSRERGSRFTVLSVGRLCREKDPGAVLEIAERIRTAGYGEGIVFRVVGAGPLDAQLRRVVQSRRLEALVELCGPREDCRAEFENADAYLSTSCGEGLSRAMLEAMAVGLPVIASAVDGNVDLVSSGETGILFNRDDTGGAAQAIIRLSVEPAEAERLGNAGHALVGREYTEARCAGEYTKLYSEISGKG
jgi:glycosyltransferase involved in cell wall biosynthesis